MPAPRSNPPRHRWISTRHPKVPATRQDLVAGKFLRAVGDNAAFVIAGFAFAVVCARGEGPDSEPPKPGARLWLGLLGDSAAQRALPQKPWGSLPNSAHPNPAGYFLNKSFFLFFFQGLILRFQLLLQAPSSGGSP